MDLRLVISGRNVFYLDFDLNTSVAFPLVSRSSRQIFVQTELRADSFTIFPSPSAEFLLAARSIGPAAVSETSNSCALPTGSNGSSHSWTFLCVLSSRGCFPCCSSCSPFHLQHNNASSVVRVNADSTGSPGSSSLFLLRIFFYEKTENGQF